MADLALAIIPLGITVTSGLIKYLKAFNDHDDDRARLVRQAERFENTFHSLEISLKRSQLTPELSISASEASICLGECQKALEDLDTLQREIFTNTTNTALTNHNAHTKQKIKDGLKKLIYPLRRSDIETLEGALNKLSTTLTLALGMLHLDGGFLMRNKLNEQMAEIQKNTIVNSNTLTVLKELCQPVSRIDLAVPAIQTSLDSIVPHVDRRFDQISYQYVQMQAQITSLLDMANTLETYQQFSYNQSGEHVNHLATRETEQKLRTLAKRADSESKCSCPSLRMRQSKVLAVGPVHFVQEMLSNHYHEKGCVFFIPSPGYEKTRTIRFTGLASVLKRSIEVSFSTRARSGVFSISPSFTYFPVVDPDVAPAFLVMAFLRDASELEKLDEARSIAILSAAQQKLKELFCSGRASPNDVSPSNGTLLHFLADLVYQWSRTLQGASSPFLSLTCEGLVNFLVAAGTSVSIRDIYGHSALHDVIDGTFVPASIYNQLIPGNDLEGRSSWFVPSWPDRLELLNYNYHNPKVARSKFTYLVQHYPTTIPMILQRLRRVSVLYGPLSLAVIRNNIREVERLIASHPRMLEEVSFYGETPVHIAIDRSDILKILAKKADPELWIQLTHSFSSVLGLAIQVSHEICNEENNSDESCCPCTLPLRIILAAGCPIMPYRDFRRGNRSDVPDGSFLDGSSHCKRILTKELQSRRRQLRDLAQYKLSITELSNFTPLEEVPDVDAIAIDRLLRQKGVLGLGPLSTFVERDLPQEPWQDAGYYSRSIFFDLNAPEDADLFLGSGFKMICTNHHYESSLDRAPTKSQIPWTRYISLGYAKWLFDHQAPLWKWSYRFTSPMPSIFVLADIIGMHDKHPDRDETSDGVERYLSESGLVDNCSCVCSPDGCTPFASRMKWLAHPHEELQDYTPQDIATKFGCYAEIYDGRLDFKHHVTMVRQATFAALELKHTCLDRPAYSDWGRDRDWKYWLDPVTELEPDEIEFEILNIDVGARNQLENVVAMFQNFVLTGDKPTVSARVDSHGIDHSLSNDPSVVGITGHYYQRVLEFWQHIWANRIRDALEAVAKGWDNNLHGQNDLVQVSTCEEAIQEAGHCSEEEDEVIFNKIVQRIQDI